MQLSKAYLAVLLSSTAVYALPSMRDPVGDDVEKGVNKIADGIGDTIGDITGGIGDIIKAIKGNKGPSKKEEEEKLRAALEERRRIAQGQLRHTEAEQAEAKKEFDAAALAADKSRAELAKIDELIAKVGIPEDDLQLLDPDHPEEPKVPEVPGEDKPEVPGVTLPYFVPGGSGP
ncbi:hypothetical protein Daus18300_004160 [Diaporthe australafricana]|uniref:Cell wall protein n=1 Tax=Diaporthe australafricana TaxID=127596 RepID=A0ABR3XBL9_9PEZI